MFKINKNIYNYLQPRIINEDINKYFVEFILCLKYLQTPTIKFQQGNNKFIFQTEQLTRSDWKNKINDISKVSIILDYSEYNKNHKVESWKSYHRMCRRMSKFTYH